MLISWDSLAMRFILRLFSKKIEKEEDTHTTIFFGHSTEVKLDKMDKFY